MSDDTFWTRQVARRQFMEQAAGLAGLAAIPSFLVGCGPGGTLDGDLGNADRSVSSLTNSGILITDTFVAGEPRQYNRAPPSSDLALGRGFDPVDLTALKRPAIHFTEVSLDHGAVEASFEFLYVSNFESMTEVLKLDRNVSASYLTNTITSALKQTYDGSFTRNSVNVVVKVWADYGRYALDARAKLTDEADALLKNDPAEFVRVYGTRYIGMESRMNAAFVVLTVESVSSVVKQSMESTLEGGVGIGKLNAKAKSVFTEDLKSTTEQDRLSINAYAIGGAGIEQFKDLAIATIKKADDPLKAIADSISQFLRGMNASNAVPYSFVVGDMRNFGLKVDAPIVWTRDRATALKTLSKLHEEASYKLATLQAIAKGSHPLAKLKPTEAQEAPVKIVQYDKYIEAIVERHENCRKNPSPTSYLPPSPDERPKPSLLEAYIDISRPPTITFTGTMAFGDRDVEIIPLDVLTMVLSEAPQKRLAVLNSFYPDATEFGVTMYASGLELRAIQLYDTLIGSTRKAGQHWSTVAIGHTDRPDSVFMAISTGNSPSLENQIFAAMRSKDRHPLVYLNDVIDYSYTLVTVPVTVFVTTN